MVDLNHDTYSFKCDDGSYPNDISEEDLKLIHHLNWLYGGYKMRNRKNDLVYNESKIFRKVQKEMDVVVKRHTNGQKRGRGRPPKSEKKLQTNHKFNKTNLNKECKSYNNQESDVYNFVKMYNKNNNHVKLTSNKYYINKTKNKNNLIKEELNLSDNKYKNEMNDQDNHVDIDILTSNDYIESDLAIDEQLLNSRNLLNRRLRFGYRPNLNDHRRPSWPQNFNLKDKIQYFINNKIADVTEFRVREPTTLSICDQFALQNHEAMVADSDRVHYYRAAIFWTGHTNENNLSSKDKILNYCIQNNMEISLDSNDFEKDQLNSDNSINSYCSAKSVENATNNNDNNESEEYNNSKENNLKQQNKNIMEGNNIIDSNRNTEMQNINNNTNNTSCCNTEIIATEENNIKSSHQLQQDMIEQQKEISNEEINLMQHNIKNETYNSSKYQQQELLEMQNQDNFNNAASSNTNQEMQNQDNIEKRMNKINRYKSLSSLNGLPNLIRGRIFEQMSSQSTETSYINSQNILNYSENESDNLYSEKLGLTTNEAYSNVSTYNENSLKSNCSTTTNSNNEENNDTDNSSNLNYYCSNKRILEIGTGPMCVLAMNAVKAGAKSVDALEVSVPASRLAGKLMAAYGFNNIINVFNTHSKLFIFDQNDYFKNFNSKCTLSPTSLTPKFKRPNFNFVSNNDNNESKEYSNSKENHLKQQNINIMESNNIIDSNRIMKMQNKNNNTNNTSCCNIEIIATEENNIKSSHQLQQDMIEQQKEISNEEINLMQHNINNEIYNSSKYVDQGNNSNTIPQIKLLEMQNIAANSNTNQNNNNYAADHSSNYKQQELLEMQNQDNNNYAADHSRNYLQQELLEMQNQDNNNYAADHSSNYKQQELLEMQNQDNNSNTNQEMQNKNNNNYAANNLSLKDNENSSDNDKLYLREEVKILLPSNPPYDMVISEILGDFASQEGVADVFLDFQRRILFENKQFIDTVKSIPYKASTMFVPSFFPDSSNIINKSSADSEMTIFSPSKKMLQSVGMRIDNLPLCDEWLPLEKLDLEQWMLPQMCQHYLNLFRVSTHGEVAGLLLGIDVEIRPGEHFGTRYGQCESWYTNFLLFDNEYTVFENDLILINSVANLTNYVKANCDGAKIDVSKPSYSFQVYILSPIDMTQAFTPKRINQNKNFKGDKNYIQVNNDNSINSYCSAKSVENATNNNDNNESEEYNNSKENNLKQQNKNIMEGNNIIDSNRNTEMQNINNNTNNTSCCNTEIIATEENNIKSSHQLQQDMIEQQKEISNEEINLMQHNIKNETYKRSKYMDQGNNSNTIPEIKLLEMQNIAANSNTNTGIQNIAASSNTNQNNNSDTAADHSSNYQQQELLEIQNQDNNNIAANSNTNQEMQNQNNNNYAADHSSNYNYFNNNEIKLEQQDYGKENIDVADNYFNKQQEVQHNLLLQQQEINNINLLKLQNSYNYDKQQETHFNLHKNTFNLNALFSDNNNKYNSHFNTVKLPCKELMDMSYDIGNVYKLSFSDLNKKYDSTGTNCSLPEDLLNEFQYVQFNGNIYKVIHRPPPIYIDYHEQTSTIYYDTPCAKRKMHTDPPKRYNKIKFKPFK